MLANKSEGDECKCTWQTSFVVMLPEIQHRLQLAFCHLSPEARDDSIGEAVVHCLLTYARLFERGRAGSVSPSSLSWYASLAVKRGRPASRRMNSKDPLSRYAQLGRGFQVERLHSYSRKREEWIDMLIEDKRSSVPDNVAAKMDVGAWLASLSQRTKQIAKLLAFGFSTSEVAQKYGVTPGRISQLRRKLEASWAAFQQEVAPAIA